MLRRLLWAIIGAIVLCENCFSATTLKYIEFATDRFDQLDSAIQEVEKSGATVVHIFPPNCVLAMLPESTQRLGANCVVYDSPASFRKSGKSPINEPAFMAWSHLYAGDAEVARNPGQIPAPLAGCVQYFADSTATGHDRNVLTSTPDLFTSNYLAGRIALSIILMESNGGDENWTQQQTDKTIAEIVQGANFLSSRAAGFGVKVSWVYETHLSVPTDYEPIEGPSVPILIGPQLRFFWIDDALSFLGFSSQWDGVFAMANSLRKNYHANWGMSTFVIMDEHVPSHTFVDGKFAYVPWYHNYPTAPYNGCFVVMTYNNGDWGPDAMDQVFRHETGHIFRAPDEYYQAGYGGCEEDDCPKKYGYLQVNNGNCEHCNDHSVFCIMRQSAYEWYCNYSLGHLGWRDTDGDGVCDAIDPNNGGWMSILNVNLGDLIRIYTVALDFVNLIAVTADNMGTQPANYVIWDGHNYDSQACTTHTSYIVTINNGEPFQRWLNGYDPVTPVFTGINYSNGNLAWNLDKSFAYVRCFIYDASNNLIAHPIWDKLYAAHYPQSLDMDFLPSGQTYTARFFGWCPDGGKSQTVNYSFTHQCIHCGDADGSGAIDISDVVFLIAHIFSGGAAPLGCQYPKGLGDANGDGSVDISDVVYLIARIFSGGKAPHCQET